ncbi:oryzin [Colletotrichum filicis]|nr:oryzin [Colletotrichum filicis]
MQASNSSIMSDEVRDVKIGNKSFRYQSGRAENLPLHTISNKGANQPSTGRYVYWRPIDTHKPVVVYVMEKDIAMRLETEGGVKEEHLDFPVPYESQKLRLGLENGTILRPNVSFYKPEYEQVQKRGIDDKRSSHGSEVVSLIAGQKFGAARECEIFVVGRKEAGATATEALQINEERQAKSKVDEKVKEKSEKTQSERGSESSKVIYDWTEGLDQVRKHFLSEKKRKPELSGIMNISVGFMTTKERRKALSSVLEAGIIVVAAAGNDNLMDLPESMEDKRVIVIGGLDRHGKRWVEDETKGSNYGKRVDYWIQAQLKSSGGATEPVDVEGTSFSTPIAVGVIARMLSSGQASTGQEVRVLLDQWAQLEDGVKHLRNGPGL